MKINSYEYLLGLKILQGARSEVCAPPIFTLGSADAMVFILTQV